MSVVRKLACGLVCFAGLTAQAGSLEQTNGLGEQNNSPVIVANTADSRAIAISGTQFADGAVASVDISLEPIYCATGTLYAAFADADMGDSLADWPNVAVAAQTVTEADSSVLQDSPLLPRLVRPQGRRLRPAARIHRLLLDVRCRYRRRADGKLARRRRHYAHHRRHADCRPWRRQHGLFHMDWLAGRPLMPLPGASGLAEHADEAPVVLLHAKVGRLLIR